MSNVYIAGSTVGSFVISFNGRTGVVVSQANDYSHDQLSGVTSDQHHAVDHDHDGSPTQQLLAANTHGTPAADTHHNKSHVHLSDGSGTVAFTSLDFTGSSLASLATRHHTSLDDVSANQHHNQLHETEHISGGGDAFASTDLLEAIIKRIKESGGPTTLTVGAIVDGEYVKRSGSTLISSALVTGVSSVFGRTGAVVAVANDYTHAQLASIGVNDHHNKVHTHADAGEGGVISTAGPDADIAIDVAGAAGTAGTESRSQHGHKLSTSNTNPVALGAAAPGTSGVAPSRYDHVHPTTGLVLTSGSLTQLTTRLHSDLQNLTVGDDHTQYQKETDFTDGSILFRGASVISQDNANFFWDRTNLRLGIGTASPAYALHAKKNASDIRLVVETTSTAGVSYNQAITDQGSLGFLVFGSTTAFSGQYANTEALLEASAQNLSLSAASGSKAIKFWRGGTLQWQFNASGHLLAGSDNDKDIGASGATRPRILYLGTGAYCPTIIGSQSSGGNLNIKSTDHATKGKVIFGDAGTTVYDEVNDRLGIGTTSPSNTLVAASTVSAKLRGLEIAPNVLGAGIQAILAVNRTDGIYDEIHYLGYFHKWYVSTAHDGNSTLVLTLGSDKSLLFASGSTISLPDGDNINWGANDQIGGSAASHYIRFITNGNVRWTINTSGHLLAGTDNTQDIGATGATRPRDLYLGGAIKEGIVGRARGIVQSGTITNTTAWTTTGATIGSIGSWTVTTGNYIRVRFQVNNGTAALQTLVLLNIAQSAGTASIKPIHSGGTALTATPTAVYSANCIASETITESAELLYYVDAGGTVTLAFTGKTKGANGNAAVTLISVEEIYA